MAKKEKTKSKTAKVLNIISLVLLALCATVLVYTTISYAKKGFVSFFSYSFHVIQTESMEPDMKVGDLVVVKQVPYSDIKVGDDILFKCEDSSLPVYGKYIIHRVIELTETEGVYRTKGIHNPNPDNVLSKAEGKAVAVSSAWGGVFSFLTNWKNVIFVIGLGGVLIFSIFEICSVVSNASKLKAEKNKQKLQNDEELKEKLKNELLDEIKKEEDEKQKVDVNLSEETNENPNEEDTAKQEAVEEQDTTKDEKGDENTWNTP